MLDGMVRYENTKKAIELFYQLKKEYVSTYKHIKDLRLEFKKISAHGRCHAIANRHAKTIGRAIKIELNNDMVNQAPWKQVKNTLLHEFAHALDCNLHSHGWKWKELAMAIGLDNPTVTSALNYDMNRKYTAYCSECGAKVSEFDRMGYNYKNNNYVSKCCRAKLTIKQNY